MPGAALFLIVLIVLFNSCDRSRKRGTAARGDGDYYKNYVTDYLHFFRSSALIIGAFTFINVSPVPTVAAGLHPHAVKISVIALIDCFIVLYLPYLIILKRFAVLPITT
jgi:hypothetical protein